MSTSAIHKRMGSSFLLSAFLVVGTSTACGISDRSASPPPDPASQEQAQQAGGGGLNTAEFDVCALRAVLASGEERWGSCMPQTYFQSDPSRRCYVHEVAGCRIVDCRSSIYRSDPVIEFPSIGTLTIASGGDQGGSRDVWTRDAHTPFSSAWPVYTQTAHEGAGWQNGESVTFTATGGELPGFSVSVPFVGYANFTLPDLARPVTIDHTKAFAIAWERTTDSVVFNLVQTRIVGFKGPVDSLEAWCPFEGRLKSASIPIMVTGLFESDPQFTTETMLNLQHARFTEIHNLGVRPLRAVTASYVQRLVTIQ